MTAPEACTLVLDLTRQLADERAISCRLAGQVVILREALEAAHRLQREHDALTMKYHAALNSNRQLGAEVMSSHNLPASVAVTRAA